MNDPNLPVEVVPTRLRDVVAAHRGDDRRHRSRGGTSTIYLPDGDTGPLLAPEAPITELEVEPTSPNLEPDRMIASSDGIAALVRRANHDQLTGLSNRSWFATAVEHDRSERSALSSALFLIDLDGFKAVNDTWGHGAGDTVLAEVGTRLEQLLRDRAIPARFGGDEFAMWVSDCTETEAILLAERIVSVVSEPVPGELGLTVGASVGWVVVTDDSPLNALLSRADIALYAVKERGGRGQQMFDRQLASQRVEGRVLQREIRAGLAEGQFRVATQTIATTDGQPIGHEVLARWQHPRRGLLAPGSFLPAIDAAGRCGEFDTHILETVLTLGPIEPGQTTWVNLTQNSLVPSTVDFFTAAVESGRMTPAQFVVEISENASAESEQMVNVIEAIAALGIAIAIDDFGSGYSRLGAMARLPISFVKIDRQFVDGVHRDMQQQVLLSAIVDLIHAIGAEAVAEGVETEQDRAVLETLGCELVQGYLIERPQLVD